MTPIHPLRILLADDHAIVREGLVALLEADEGYRVVAQAGDGIEAVEKALECRPDVAVIDLSMPRLGGLEVVKRISQKLPDTRILVLTHHDEQEYVLPLVRAGAHGYLVKDTAGEELRKAIATLVSGHSYFGPQAASIIAEAQRRPPGEHADDPYERLTPREREVMHLVCEGRSTKEVARILDIGTKTAENHRSRILDKLDLSNTAELVRYAARRGLID